MALPIPSGNNERQEQMSTRVIDFKTVYRVGKDPVDKVLLAPAGAAFERTRTWHAIKDIKPKEDVDEGVKNSLSYQAMLGRWEVVGPLYEAWKKGQELPETGTPLEAWGGVTAEQVAALKAMGIRTVEDVAEMGDRAAEQLRMPNARKLPELAKSFLGNTDMAARDAENAELKERIKAMEEMLAEKMSAEPKAEEKPKRKPGRPRKTEAA